MTNAPLHHAAFDFDPLPPFDLHLTAEYATNYRVQNLWEFYEGGVYRRVVDLPGGRLAVAAVRSTGTVEAPSLRVDLASPSPLSAGDVDAARRHVAWALQTGVDVRPFYRAAEADAFLGPLTASHRGFRVPQGSSVLEGLVHAILGQQISGQVARVLRTRLMETYGPALTVDGVDYRAFPRAAVLADAGAAGLRELKLSARKAEYIADICAKESAGEIDLEGLYHRADDEVVAALTALRGVGEWTAHWLLVRTLGRPDGFPHGDLALQRTLGDAVNAGVRLTANEALAYSQRWSPYRTYATTYIFANIRSGRADWRAPTSA